MSFVNMHMVWRQNCLVLIFNFMCMFFCLWKLQVCFVGLKILCCVSFSLYVVYGSHVLCFFDLVSCMCFQIFMGCLLMSIVCLVYFLWVFCFASSHFHILFPLICGWCLMFSICCCQCSKFRNVGQRSRTSCLVTKEFF
jgi:hypothetical protein